MLVRALVRAAVLAALLVPAGARTVQAAGPASYIGLIRHDNVAMRTAPKVTAHVVTMLVQQSQVQVMSTRGSWAKVKVWDSITGWVQRAEVVRASPWATTSTYKAPEFHYRPLAHGSQVLTVAARTVAPTALVTSPGGRPVKTLRAGRAVTISAWQQDSAGKVWYHIGGLWALGDSVQFVSPDPGRAEVNGHLLASKVAGKGMWLTLGIFAQGDPEALATAAQRNGITHIYLESAISPLGFHGKKSVGPAIDAAHRHHIKVIAWVFPYLYDVAGDVQLTREVADFRSTSGERFDGIAADLEQNVQLWNVRAYSQLVRAYLGPRYLLVGVPYPPESMPDYPYGEMAKSYNVIAPMDYWHQTKTANGLDFGHMAYGYAYARQYAQESVAAIRAMTGDVAIEPIGQTFDDFGRLEMGPYAPSAAEINGFLAGSKASGSIGASFFQWMTTTDAEWNAIHDFRY